MTSPNFMVIGFQIRKLHRGAESAPPAVLDSKKPGLFRVKKRYPHSFFTVTLGENQDTAFKRIDSFKKGYLRGSPDLIINNLHKHYTGFCIEFKSPKGNGVLSPDQSMILLQYQNNGFKILVSNDYDQIIEQIIEYFRDVRILCSHCPRRFISSQSLSNHIKSFHKMA